MKNIRNRVVIVVVLLLMVLLIVGCGSSSKKVPDSQIEAFVMDSSAYKEYEQLYQPYFSGHNFTWSATHNYDSESHLDFVTIKAEWETDSSISGRTTVATYQYDRSSGNWTMLDHEIWEPYGR